MPAPNKRLTAFVVAMAVLIATPLAVVASDAFTDVPDSNVHHADITWLADAGVTLGCNPPANTNFCPGDPVLRQQMASFLRRLAENKVVDAATAEDANMLGGEGPVSYRTDVAAVACLFGSATECPDVTSVDPATSVLSLSINAESAGTLVIDSVFQPADNHYAWLTVDNSCGPLATTEFTPNGVTGTLSLSLTTDALESSNPSAAVSVGAGNHTVRLCGAAGTPEVVAASLTVVWTEGTGGIALASDSPGSIDPDLVDRVRQALQG